MSADPLSFEVSADIRGGVVPGQHIPQPFCQLVPVSVQHVLLALGQGTVAGSMEPRLLPDNSYDL